MRKKITFLLILIHLAGCAHQNKTITDSSHYSKTELELGEEINRRILQTMPAYREEKLNHYVQTIGQNLAKRARRKDLQYRFVILEDDRIYATYAPGGYVYITTGFFKFLTSEIEIAGILAHEIGRLQYKDPRFSKAKKALDLMILTGAYVGPAFGTVGALSVLGLAIVGNFTNGEKTMTQQTYDADKRAFFYMMGSGYDPQGLIDPMRRMMDTTSSYRAYLYDYLQSHPVSPKRLIRLDRTFLKLPLQNTQFDSRRKEFLNLTESVRSH
ncbi:MAG: M48 family metalloprotease [Candidatus Omnitrophica bacterium]|nr:M48 family metalloprotease [Candidatus Omnitrophota bacterium]